MKAPFILFSALMAAGTIASFAESTVDYSTTLGTTMYVGDSITHGVNSASWRWALHKILVDNGISYNSVGINTGNYSNGVAAGTEYGGVAFNNVHSAQSSGRAWEISGRKAATRYGGSNIKNWLGQSTTTAAGNAYSGSTWTDVDTFVMLIGTNDLLSDSQDVSTAQTRIEALLGDVETILDSMYTCNEDAEVYIFAVPCWTNHANGNSDDIHSYVESYNEQLATTLDAYNTTNGTNAVYVDLNCGILDVASTTSFYGCSSMFNSPGSDGLHPNAQGDLIIAGNLAKAMGYAGRSAGQVRKTASEFSTYVNDFSGTLPDNISLSGTAISGTDLVFSGSTGTLVAEWLDEVDLSLGYTLDLGVTVGDGSENGWDTANNLSISLGNGKVYGTLNINEAYIQWGSTVLYSTDMSLLDEDIRVAYVNSRASEGLSGGFYVWLGDMLIGEALSATTGTNVNGATITYSGSGTVTLSSFALTDTSYAPTTTRIVNEADAYIASIPQKVVTIPLGNVNVEAVAEELGVTATIKNDLTASGEYYINQTKGPATALVWGNVVGGSATTWYGIHNSANGTSVTASVGMTLSDNCEGGTTIFGTIASGAKTTGTVTGNIYLHVTAENAVFTTYSTGSSAPSVVGAYRATITGTFYAQLDAGTYNYNVIGGLQADAGSNYIGSTVLYINGGTYNANIFGGGAVASIGTSETDSETTVTSVYVTNGTIAGGVYGGGLGDTIYGSTNVEITGGEVGVGFFGGGTGGTIVGNTNLLLDDYQNAIQIAKAGTISAGGTGGTIGGNATLTIKNVASMTDLDLGLDKFAGTITGGENVAGTRSLVLDNVAASFAKVTIENFDELTVTGESATTLSSFGGAFLVNIDENSSLSISNEIETFHRLTIADGSAFTGTVASTGGICLDLANVTDTESFTVKLGGLVQDEDIVNVYFLQDGELHSVELTDIDWQAGSATALLGEVAATREIEIDSADATSSNTFSATKAAGVFLGNIHLTSTGELSATNVFGNSDYYIGNLDVTFTAGTGYMLAIVGNSGTVEGNVGLEIAGESVKTIGVYGVKGGEVSGDVDITITAGTITGGVYGGHETGTIHGNVNVVLDNADGVISLGTNATIAAGTQGASIDGNANVTLKNFDESFSNFSGLIVGNTNDTVAGTTSLTFDAVNADLTNARVSKFDTITVQNGSSLALANLDVSATTISILDSTLKLDSVTAGTLVFSEIGGNGNVQMDEVSHFQSSGEISLNAEAVGYFESDENIVLADAAGTYAVAGITTTTLDVAGTQTLTVSDTISVSDATTLAGTLNAVAGTLGDLTMSDSGSLVLAGTVSAKSISFVDDANVSISGAGTLDAGTLEIADTLSNVTLSITDSTIAGDVILNGETNELLLENATITGDLLAYAGTITISGTNIVEGGLLIKTAVTLIEATPDAVLKADSLIIDGEEALLVVNEVYDPDKISARSNSNLIEEEGGKLTSVSVKTNATFTQNGGTVETVSVDSANFVQNGGEVTGTLSATNAALTLAAGTINALELNDSAVEVTGTPSVTTLTAATGESTISGAGTLSAGTISVASDATLTISEATVAGTFDLQDDSTLKITNNATLSKGLDVEGTVSGAEVIVENAKVSGDVLVAGTNNLTISNATISGTTTVSDDATLTQVAGTLNDVVVFGANLVQESAGTISSLVVVNDVNLQTAGTVKTLTVETDTMATAAGTFSADAISVESDASLTVSGTGTTVSAGTLNVAENAEFIVADEATFVGDLTIGETVAGTVMISNATVDGKVTLDYENASLKLNSATVTGDFIAVTGTLTLTGENVIGATTSIGELVKVVSATGANSTVEGTISGTVTVEENSTLTQTGDSTVTNVVVENATFAQESGTAENVTLNNESTATIAGTVEELVVSSGSSAEISGVAGTTSADTANLIQTAGTLDEVTLTNSTFTQTGGEVTGTISATENSKIDLAGTVATVEATDSQLVLVANSTSDVTLKNSTNVSAGEIGNVAGTLTVDNTVAQVTGTISGTTTVENGANVSTSGTLADVVVENATFEQTAGTLETLNAKNSNVVKISGTSGDVALTDGTARTTVLGTIGGDLALDNSAVRITSGGVAGTTNLSNNATMVVESAGTIRSATLASGSAITMAGTLVLDIAQGDKIQFVEGTQIALKYGSKLTLSYQPATVERSFSAVTESSNLAEYLASGGVVTIFEGDGEIVEASNFSIEDYLKTDSTLATLATETVVVYDVWEGLKVRLATSNELFADISIPSKLQSLFDALELNSRAVGFMKLDENSSTLTSDDPIVNMFLNDPAAGTKALKTLSPLAYSSMIAIPQAVHGNDIRSISNRLDARRYDKYTGKEEVSLFVQVQGQNTENGSGSSSPNFDFYTTGAFFGADYKLSKDLIVGAALGTDFGRAKISNGGGKIESSNVRVNLFAGTTFADLIYVNAGTHFGVGNYDIKRHTILGSCDEDTNGVNLGANIEVGCLIPILPEAGFYAMPHVNFSYLYSQVDSFEDAAFDIDNFHSNSVRGGAGLTFSWQAMQDLRLTLDFSYSHEFCDDDVDIDYTYNGKGLSINAPIEEEDVFSASIGFEARIYGNQSLYGGYTFEAGTYSEISHGVNLGLRARF